MATTVPAPRRFIGHLWTWVQASILVYLIGFGIVLLGAAVALLVRGVMEVTSWVAETIR